jgi:cytochrome c551/c552
VTARQKDVLGWVAVLLVGVGAFVVTRPKTDPNGRIDRPGANTETGAPTARVSFGAKLDKGQDGAVVLEVFAGSNAERAGVRVGDTIVQVNGKPCPEPKVFTTALAATAPGGVLELELRRADGTVAPVRVTIYPESGFEGDLAARLIGDGVAQLVSARRADGLWPHYQDPSRPSLGVTALVGRALARVERDLDPAGKDALAGARKALLAAQTADGGVSDPPEPVPHRVYATSLAVLALQGDAGAADARARMVRFLTGAQVGEAQGFELVDWRYGGWSYYDTFASDRLRTDVSTLRFALEALAAEKLPDDDRTWERARLWLDATQNLTLASAEGDRIEGRERELRDGGFGFTPRMSKAGSDAIGSTLSVFRSYGSATADGLLGLLCVGGVDRSASKAATLGLPAEPLAAARWLARRWSLGGNPGFEGDAAGWSQAILYYWLAALARGLHRAGVATVVDGDGAKHDWAGEVVRQLATLHARQRERFANPAPLMHEDSPTVAGAFAVLALADARDRLALGGGAVLEAGGKPTPRAADVALPAGDASAAERGKAVFHRSGCIGCHVDGAASNGPSLVGIGERALGRWRTPKESAAGLFAFVRAPSPEAAFTRGAWAAPMQPFNAAQLDDAALKDLAEFLVSRLGTRPVSEAR